MIRFLFRFLGLWMIAAAFVFFVYDGTKSIADRGLYFTKVGDVWAWIHQDSLLLLQPAIERHLMTWIWDPVVVTVLTAPASLMLGILGTFLILLGRKKKPLIGYARS
jgi:hypothetical protein